MDMDKEGWAVRGAAAGVGSAGNSIKNLRHVFVCVCVSMRMCVYLSSVCVSLSLCRGGVFENNMYILKCCEDIQILT